MAQRIFVAVVAVTFSLLIGWYVFPAAIAAYENVSLSLEPSTEKAYAYGLRHFDSERTYLYDENRAQELFIRVLSMDPKYPYVQHQLARVAFLKGDFPLALARIDLEIENHPNPSSYYVRGLIKGFKGEYAAAAADYEHYLESDPNNWAALNDLAWVKLKAGKPREAAEAASRGLAHSPENPWLFNTLAIALYETGEYDDALSAAQKADRLVTGITERDWLVAYPGNDPQVASEGIASLRQAIAQNMRSIELAVASRTPRSR